ncbi:MULTISPECIES: DUF4190 domain-containing protein [unclassified Nocardiopsis]|uniref:DUF4190 domain-containing protein n=1 Tax=unclassified Nocardiopsis TaxID=2649073 RepID=UPI0019160BA3|nr:MULTISPECIES: DUF4190 domain-containing protein [unclassified Nocardiopsis]
MSENWRTGPPDDPYAGAPNQYGAEPYKDPTGGYGGYGPASGYGVPPHQDPAGPYTIGPRYPAYGPPPHQGGAIAALVVSILMVLSCCALPSIGGIVFASMALSSASDPEKAGRDVRNAWIANGVSVGLIVLCAVVIVIAVATA